MTQSDEILLKLVRFAIGTERELSIPDTADWDKVVESAYNQAIPAIVADGIQKLYDAYPGLDIQLDKPEKEELKYELFASSMSLEQDYDHLCSVISDISSVLNNAEIRMMVLKGYGLSLYYPVPSHRPVGDIDIYTFGKWHEADALMKSKYNVKVDESNPHHTVFKLKGLTIENHVSFLNNYSHKANRAVEEKLEILADSCRDTVTVNNGEIVVPTPQFNALFLLRHAAGHFATEKLSVRQILDWALFVQKNTAKIDWPLLLKDAKESNMHLFLACLNSACVSLLGFDQTLFPTLKLNRKLEKRFAEDIMCPEFESEIPSRKRRIRYAWVKSRRFWTNRWKYRIVYDEPLAVSFWNLAINRIKN